MITFSVASTNNPRYEEILKFARKIYSDKLSAFVSGTPDFFSYAETNGQIVGCFGLYLAETHYPLTIEGYFSHDIFQMLSKRQHTPRSLCGEVGTRAVEHPNKSGLTSSQLSMGLAAQLVVLAEEYGLEYLVMTANRTVKHLAQGLGIEMVELGDPDLSQKSAEFLQNWKEFFKVKQSCFGVRVSQSSLRCRKALIRLSHNKVPEEA